MKNRDLANELIRNIKLPKPVYELKVIENKLHYSLIESIAITPHELLPRTSDLLLLAIDNHFIASRLGLLELHSQSVFNHLIQTICNNLSQMYAKVNNIKRSSLSKDCVFLNKFVWSASNSIPRHVSNILLLINEEMLAIKELELSDMSETDIQYRYKNLCQVIRLTRERYENGKR